MTNDSERGGEEITRLRARLRHAEARLEEIQRIAGVGYVEWNVAEGSGWCSGPLNALLGRAADAAPLRFEEFLEMVRPEDRETLRVLVVDAIRGRKAIEADFIIVRPDGGTRALHARADPLTNPAGDLDRYAGTVQDVTEKKKLVQALSESESRYAGLFEKVPLGVAALGPDGKFILSNSTWVAMTGYSAEELSRMSPLDLTHPDDRDRTQWYIRQTRVGKLNDFGREKRFIKKNGEVFWGRIVGSVFRDSDRHFLYSVGIVEDVTEKKLAEESRARKEREQRDALVREVHHRIKNHVQGIATLLERHAADNPQLGAAVAKATSQLNAIALVHGLYSSYSGEELNLCNILGSIVEGLRIAAPIPLEFVLPEDFEPVELSRDQAVPLALVLNELVSNAYKHVERADTSTAIHVVLRREGMGATVLVRSRPARLPPGFDFESGRALGTGLRLAKLLLSGEGARITFRQPALEVVEAVLELSPPVVQAGS